MRTDWFFTRYLNRRCRKRTTTICRRRSDGTLWAASSAQNPAFALGGLFTDEAGWHFAKVRMWRGIPIVGPKVFWAFNQPKQFDVVEKDATAFWLSPWPVAIETEKLAA